MLLNEMKSPKQQLARALKLLEGSYNYTLDVSKLNEAKANAMIAHGNDRLATLKENNGSMKEIQRMKLIVEALQTWKVASIQTELTAPAVKPAKKKQIAESVDDSGVEEAKVILAAQEMADQLQKMIEDLAKMQVQDLIPVVDAMKSEIGTAEAEQFNQSVDEALGSLLDSAKATKDRLTNSILSAQGQAPTDMERAGDEFSDEPSMGDDLDALGGDDDMDMGMDDDFGGDPAAQGDDELLGREMKEESVDMSELNAMLESIQAQADSVGRVSRSSVQKIFNEYKKSKNK